MMTDWRAIPGFPHYEASAGGDVRRSDTAAILKAHPDDRGYQKLTIYDADGRLRSVWLHRLVCTAFHGAPMPGQQARHRNGLKADCTADNLCWGTRADNAADRRAHMIEKGLPYTGLRPAVPLRGLLPSVRAEILGRFLGAPKTLRTIRQAFKSGLINKSKALEMIQSL
jgi:hypothetical protein